MFTTKIWHKTKNVQVHTVLQQSFSSVFKIHHKVKMYIPIILHPHPLSPRGWTPYNGPYGETPTERGTFFQALGI